MKVILQKSVSERPMEEIFGQESILAPYRRLLAETPRKIRLAWYDYAIRFCDKEDFLTHTEHLMIVSRKEGKK